MKTIARLGFLFPLLFTVLNTRLVFGQTKADVFDEKTPIAWLGLDYSQVKFIGAPTDYESKSDSLTSEKIIHTYMPAWNGLFTMQQKKFDVAKAIHRSQVNYMVDLTEKQNRQIKRELFTKDSLTFKTLDEQKISDLVKNYDFGGNTGIGMLFFIEGISKAKEKEGAWITFVDMGSKTLIYTSYQVGKTGGMGFRNTWINPAYWMLKQFGEDPQWKK
jgi:hypothetical protein